MIDFRYHVVSIIAVFLALSVGLVLGSSFFQEAAVADLDKRVQDLRRSNDGLRRDFESANTSRDQLNAFISASTPDLVDGKLAGRSVVVITLPGADSKIADNAGKLVDDAGGIVTGRVQIKGAWADPKQETTLAAALTAPGEVTPAVTGATVAERAANLLAQAVVNKKTEVAGPDGEIPATGHPSDRPSGQPGGQAPATSSPSASAGTSPSPSGSPSAGASRTPAARPTAGSTPRDPEAAAGLHRLEKAGFVDLSGDPTASATLALVVAPGGTVGGDDPARAIASYLAITRALDAADDGTVLAGPASAAQDGGLVNAMRRDERTAKVVSSVDSADSPPGQVAVVWALAGEEQLTRSGQYGVVGATEGWLPKLPEETTS